MVGNRIRTNAVKVDDAQDIGRPFGGQVVPRKGR